MVLFLTLFPFYGIVKYITKGDIMIIPVLKHYFDTFDNRLIVKIKDINLSLEDSISLQVDDKVYNINNHLKIKNLQDNSYQLRIDTPNNVDIKSKSIKLLIVKKGAKSSRDKIIVNLTYIPNIIKNYSEFWLHRVSEGESLEDIAQKYFGDKSLAYKIYEANIDRIEDITRIKNGQFLRIPRVYK